MQQITNCPFISYISRKESGAVFFSLFTPKLTQLPPPLLAFRSYLLLVKFRYYFNVKNLLVLKRFSSVIKYQL